MEVSEDKSEDKIVADRLLPACALLCSVTVHQPACHSPRLCLDKAPACHSPRLCLHTR